jgi:hypothetical protein
VVKLCLLASHSHPGLNVLIRESHGFGPSGVVHCDFLPVKGINQFLVDLDHLVHEGLSVLECLLRHLMRFLKGLKFLVKSLCLLTIVLHFGFQLVGRFGGLLVGKKGIALLG